MQTVRLLIKSKPQDIPIYIDCNLWGDLKNYLEHNFSGHTIFIISDNNVAKLYSKQISLELASVEGFQKILTFPAGEQSKNRRIKEKLEDEILELKSGRGTVIIACGGGVTGDLAGFVSATLFRGIPLIHVPTTLLAQVDSSIGGKVGINHEVGKNLIGAFYQPHAIFTDIDFLQTLALDEFINGMTEVIKYGAILDNELWNLVENEHQSILQKDTTVLESVIRKCIQLKIDVVEKDEKEKEYRSILNFGHTVGHAIEKLSEFKIKHGQAISFGMKIAARLSHQLIGYPEDQVNRLEQTLNLYGLNFSFHNDFPLDKIWETIITDKKSLRKTPRFTLLKNLSQPELYFPVQKKDLEHVYKQT